MPTEPHGSHSAGTKFGRYKTPADPAIVQQRRSVEVEFHEFPLEVVKKMPVSALLWLRHEVTPVTIIDSGNKIVR